jgi:hypothetical protein
LNTNRSNRQVLRLKPPLVLGCSTIINLSDQGAWDGRLM